MKICKLLSCYKNKDYVLIDNSLKKHKKIYKELNEAKESLNRYARAHKTKLKFEELECPELYTASDVRICSENICVVYDSKKLTKKEKNKNFTIVNRVMSLIKINDEKHSFMYNVRDALQSVLDKRK